MKRFVLALAVALVSHASWVQAQAPAGPEFHVNTFITGAQIKPTVAVSGNGNFVIVWQSYNQDGEYAGVFGQRYDRAGAVLGAEFQVNTFTTDSQYVPQASADKAGNFVVVWTSYTQDGDGYGIFGQRYDATGTPTGGEFQVNTYTTGFQGGPTNAVFPTHSVSMNASGNFVVAWHGYGDTATTTYGILARRYDPAGAPIGAEFLVNEDPTAGGYFPATRLADDGSFVVVWGSLDASNTGVLGRRFDATGSPVGGEFQVNETTTGFQQFGSADFTGTDGSFVVTWNSQNVDGDAYAVMARRFDGNGNAVGGEFQVNTFTTGTQYGLPPRVEADQLGNFVVSWSSEYGDTGGGAYGTYGVRAQRFAADGTPRGAEFQVNTFTTNFQDLPQLGSDPSGNFIVSWRSSGQEAPGTSGVYAQRFGGFSPLNLFVDGTGNGVIEPGETAGIRPIWVNHNGATLPGVGGGLANPAGPGGALYTITDGTAVYGDVANGNAATCTDCYALQVDDPATRPAAHWDASADESITPDALGTVKRWGLHIGESFTDVSTTGLFYSFIENLFHNGVTAGCAPGQYCPLATTTRQEMSVFVLVANEGAGFVPPACTAPPFNDVPQASPFCPFIAELSNRGVVAGCGSGNFCPANPVTRAEMAVFALATLEPSTTPPPCAVPPFADVPITSPFCPFIAELQARGVVAGCGGGNYCPGNPVLRQEMSVFISATFGLTLYGL